MNFSFLYQTESIKSVGTHMDHARKHCVRAEPWCSKYDRNINKLIWHLIKKSVNNKQAFYWYTNDY